MRARRQAWLPSGDCPATGLGSTAQRRWLPPVQRPATSAGSVVPPRPQPTAPRPATGPGTDPRPARRRPRLGTATVAAAVLFGSCQEQLPTSVRDDLVPAGVVVEVTLPFEDFASNVRVYGGFGRASDRGVGFVAHEFGGGADETGRALPLLEARTLVRFGAYPASASVRDTTGTLRTDSAIAFVSGRIVAALDTAGSVAAGPVEVVAREVTEAWDASATWSDAVDTLGGRVPWSEAGGGPGREVVRGVWDPAEGDTLFLPVDSARLREWSDTAAGVHGIRLETTTPGARLDLRSVSLSLLALPSINPDTIADLRVSRTVGTFIYDPPAPPPAPGEARVGGVPAWRSVLDLRLPPELAGPPALCAAVPCPVRFDDSHVSYAALQLVSRVAAPAFAPSDTLGVEVRSVLAPDYLPKSPLGPSLTGLAGARFPPEWFAAPAGEVAEIPITGLVRDLRRPGADASASRAIALLSPFEPLSLEYLSFEASDPARAPRLRLVLVFSQSGR